MERLTSWSQCPAIIGSVLVRDRRLGEAFFDDPRYYHDYCDALEKLARYEDAEEQGRLIVLPCKVGETIYYIKTLQNGADTKVIEQDTVKRIIFDGIDNQIVISYNHSFMMCDFNRLLFLSREEAEKALDGIK